MSDVFVSFYFYSFLLAIGFIGLKMAGDYKENKKIERFDFFLTIAIVVNLIINIIVVF